MHDPITSWIEKKLIDAAWTKASASIKGMRSKFSISLKEVEDALSSHMIMVNNWANEVNQAEKPSNHCSSGLYVEMDCYVTPRSRRADEAQPLSKVPLDSLFNGSDRHVVILGGPGAGKTTSVRNLCSRLLRGDLFIDGSYPILVKLRELSTDHDEKFGVVEKLINTLGLAFQFPPFDLESVGDIKVQKEEIAFRALTSFLDESQAVIILDGFDELYTTNQKDRVLSQTRKLMLNLNAARVILTSRTGQFPYEFENGAVYEICPLDADQIAEFARKRLISPDKVESFLEGVAQSPFRDTAIRPLTLSHLCAVYLTTGAIPDKPKNVYNKVLSLVLADWDEARSVKRLSRYSTFDASEKQSFLSALAYHVCTVSGKVVFSSDDIRAFYRAACEDYGLPKNEAKVVAGEIESHTGLLLHCGPAQFEFAHKSLQEFLAAQYITLQPEVPLFGEFHGFPDEMALSVTLSSSPIKYLQAILERCSGRESHREFIIPFIIRLFQEKVDFRRNEETFWTLMNLYSLAVKSTVGADIDPDSIRALEDFIFKVAIFSTTIDSYYMLSEDFVPFLHGTITLERCKSVPHHVAPKQLVVRPDFWNHLRNWSDRTA